jgi:hypothetical protein
MTFSDTKITGHAPQTSSNARNTLTSSNKALRPEMCAKNGDTPNPAKASCCLGVPARRKKISKRYSFLRKADAFKKHG